MSGDKGRRHPLPQSGEARHGEIPETDECEKGRGEDEAEVIQPGPDAAMTASGWAMSRVNSATSPRPSSPPGFMRRTIRAVSSLSHLITARP